MDSDSAQTATALLKWTWKNTSTHNRKVKRKLAFTHVDKVDRNAYVMHNHICHLPKVPSLQLGRPCSWHRPFPAAPSSCSPNSRRRRREARHTCGWLPQPQWWPWLLGTRGATCIHIITHNVSYTSFTLYGRKVTEGLKRRYCVAHKLSRRRRPNSSPTPMTPAIYGDDCRNSTMGLHRWQIQWFWGLKIIRIRCFFRKE